MMDSEPQTHRNERLAVLMQSVGFAVWQLQELETSVATYLVIRVHAHRGIGTVPGEQLIKKAEGRTLGSLVTELAKSGVIDGQLSVDLREVLEQRNWLVHRACRENRGILASPKQFSELLVRLEALAHRSLELLKEVASGIENHVLSCGVDRRTIDSEADRLARSWALFE